MEELIRTVGTYIDSFLVWLSFTPQLRSMVLLRWSIVMVLWSLWSKVLVLWSL